MNPQTPTNSKKLTVNLLCLCLVAIISLSLRLWKGDRYDYNVWRARCHDALSTRLVLNIEPMFKEASNDPPPI